MVNTKLPGALSWTAVAERSGDTAFGSPTKPAKRRGASLPAAVQKDSVALSWTAVAERSGDTAFGSPTKLVKRRGASLPAAAQKDLVALSWTAVAERSGDTAFGSSTELAKRRGASLPAAVQKDSVQKDLGAAWLRPIRQLALNDSLILVMSLGLAGCAHYPVNAPKTVDRPEGYYYQNHKRENNSDDILMLLAFSGGGTRASAFSYGVLEALRDTTFDVDGKKRRLLDEVDAISSVSGGSVTAAAYGLYGDRVFDVFESAFLKRNVQRALLGHVVNPLHWPALWSSTYGRSDMAAEYYDKILFKNARFGDLETNNTPFLMINTTDAATGTRLSFTQHFFDLLASDLNSYPVSRAVAASSAVPGALSPITLNNYSGQHPVPAPEWLAKQYGPDTGMAGRQARALKLFLNSTNYPYLHLVDGGVSDNLGLRVYLEALSYLALNPELLHQGSLAKIRKVVFICVNAHVRDEKGWDRKAKTPGSIPVAVVADADTMQHYSSDTLAWLGAAIERLRNHPDLNRKVDFYSIDLSFDQFSESSQASYFLNLPTTFFLKDHVVDELRTAAHTLLYQHPDFKRLMTDLGASSTGVK